MNTPNIEDLQAALGVAIAQRNAAQDALLHAGMTDGQLRRRIAALEAEADARKLPTDGKIDVRKTNGSAEHATGGA